MKIRYADCYAGIGGFATGLIEAIKEIDHNIELENVLMSEVKVKCIKQYNHNFKLEHNFIGFDMNKSDYNSWPEMDVIFAGFPCPPYSQAGSLKGLKDDRSDAIFRLLDLVKIKKPKWFIFENVANFVNFDEKRIYGFFTDRLRDLGYFIDIKPLILNVKDFGIPHNRLRVYIVGIRNDIKFNDMIFQHLWVKPNYKLKSIYERDQDVDESLVLRAGDKNDYFNVLYGWDKFLEIVKSKNLSIPHHLYGFVFYDETWWERNKDVKYKKKNGLDSIYFYKDNKKWIDEWIKEFNFLNWPKSLQQLITSKEFNGDMKSSVIQFRQSGFRVMKNNIFPTIAHNLQHNFVFRESLGWTFITEREYLRLQGFPDWYTWMSGASRSFIHNSIGNAVNVEVVKFICKLVIGSIIRMG